METTATRRKPQKSPRVPDFLVKEILDGKPVYYKNYKSVLRKEKTINEIRSASGLQIFIIRYLFRLLDRHLDESQYYVFTGEGGLYIGKGNNTAGDVMVFDRQQLTPDLINEHYLTIPPVLNIEIDVEIDNGNFTDYEYMERKTKNLLAFGVQKVVWILTKPQQIIVAEPQKDWLVIDWIKDVELLNGLIFNVPSYLTKEGLQF